MEQEFEAQAYGAACIIMGEAVWQLVARGEQLTPDAVARTIVVLSEHRYDLAASIALSVLRSQYVKVE